MDEGTKPREVMGENLPEMNRGGRAQPSGTKGKGVQQSDEKEVFKIPDDEEVFAMRERERRQHAHSCSETQSTRVERKATLASSLQKAVPPGYTLRRGADSASITKNASHRTQSSERSLSLPAMPHRRKKDNMNELTKKKREIFLEQMSIHYKRSEMEKLEERVRAREEAIKESEQTLDDNSERFDKFIQENDAKVRNAIKRADQQAKAKAEMEQEGKRLKASIQAVNSELNKHDEQLRECYAHKRFLDELTPPEWLKEQRRYLGIAEDGSEDEQVKEMPVYFTKPQQLFDTFDELEEKNLFLIQNLQETEQALEELKSKLKNRRDHFDPQARSLEQQKEELERAIEEEKKRAQSLAQLSEQSNTHTGRDESSLDELSSKVMEVYLNCGFVHDDSIATLQMLTNIEQMMESYLSYVEQVLKPEQIRAAEQEREQQRRQKVREERFEQQRKDHEARYQRALERAQAPVHKKEGKPVMFRSAPPLQKKKEGEEKPQGDVEEEELQAFLQREI